MNAAYASYTRSPAGKAAPKQYRSTSDRRNQRASRLGLQQKKQQQERRL